ncbi:hypothetical protein E3T46_09795 [Cryobacterium sp. Hh11]|uniref:hypothetical protein n=1 Tax=Cryobacterium sp. Hh11 TaxID=2555868 RepID=UPI00106C2AF2|nr:hypothetical protein [Cryobacterium sp. Hh11]TFD51505.1 hypothetical protein E3T46_09795 [Cryobacterium sp. Hh11]
MIGGKARVRASATGVNVSSASFEAVEFEDELYGCTVWAAVARLSAARKTALTAHVLDPIAFFRDLHTGVWQDIRQSVPADEFHSHLSLASKRHENFQYSLDGSSAHSG